MERLCDGAYWSGIMLLNPKNPGKPGEYLERRTTAEEREILKNLTADDIQNVRPVRTLKDN